MHSTNVWGGPFGIQKDLDQEERHHQKSGVEEWDKSSLLYQEHINNNNDNNNNNNELDEVQLGWVLAPQETRKSRMNKYVDLGCIVVSKKLVKWVFWSFLVAFIIIAMPIIIAKCLPKHKNGPPPPDNYTLALNKALLFFNAQKSGRLPKKNDGVEWRGNSGLTDGSKLRDVKGGLVGGYYDSGENTKFHFPMAFAMTMLSWSVIEYPHKFKAIGEYDHVRDLIKWGTDYLLLTFNSTASTIDKIYSQVGGGQPNSTVASDMTCWQRPEDMSYARPVQTAIAGSDLGGEMAAALAAASIVFQDDRAYSSKLRKGAETVFKFANDTGKRDPYSRGNAWIAPYYNSTGYNDELIWGATWLYYATGNNSYISLATDPELAKDAKAFRMNTKTSYLSWDNKLPAAMLLLTRFRMLLNPGYPYEQTLSQFHKVTGLNMCSYLRRFQVYNWTEGGMIALNNGGPKPLQYVANAAFLANLFADYMNVTGVPGWKCGPVFLLASKLRKFATSQIDYILGKNPLHMSYLVGFGDKYPTHVHHRGASVPKNTRKYSCKEGNKYRDAKNPNPNTLFGAMVGGPNKLDKFQDNRLQSRYTEPTLAGNAGLVAALVSLTETAGSGVDRNLMFSSVPPLYTPSPPPPAPWKP
ncbi:hypothetical protein vseg_021638 [Gypsophila vaccaria]